jgi:hypothetical protein
MNNPDSNQIVPGSFRDPSGFLFHHNGSIYRQINQGYQGNYDHFMNSGLYQELVNGGLLIPHEEVEVRARPRDLAKNDPFYRTIQPEPISFISYPYEWCFSQLKDAALTTLAIQKKAFEFGMSLKDSSAYNIQYHHGKPLLIDTLSFEKYREGEPWVAYRQFCQHFLAPLALMSYRDIRLGQLLRIYIDGIPLDLASSLLPSCTHWVFSLLTHIHLHAKSQRHYAASAVQIARKMNRISFLGLIDNLESAIRKLKWRPPATEWADYYSDTNYQSGAFTDKKQIVAQLLDIIHPKKVWDLGANTGVFSRLASEKGMETISFDLDPAAVEKNYLDCIAAGETQILPLILDLTNPSSGIGWANQERMSLAGRGPADTLLALALIHHLAISNNTPLLKIAEFFSGLCQTLIIEFVPKSDTQVKRLLATRADIFTDYHQPAFEREFSQFFTILKSIKIRNSERTIYLMEKRTA